MIGEKNIYVRDAYTGKWGANGVSQITSEKVHIGVSNWCSAPHAKARAAELWEQMFDLHNGSRQRKNVMSIYRTDVRPTRSVFGPQKSSVIITFVMF